jgi:hypothetical protein
MGPRTPLLEHSSGIRAMVPHPIPLCWCIEPWELGRPFYNAVKFGIVQYMILKTVCALVALVLELFRLYGDGLFEWYYGYENCLFYFRVFFLQISGLNLLGWVAILEFRLGFYSVGDSITM